MLPPHCDHIVIEDIKPETKPISSLERIMDLNVPEALSTIFKQQEANF